MQYKDIIEQSNNPHYSINIDSKMVTRVDFMQPNTQGQ